MYFLANIWQVIPPYIAFFLIDGTRNRQHLVESARVGTEMGGMPVTSKQTLNFDFETCRLKQMKSKVNFSRVNGNMLEDHRAVRPDSVRSSVVGAD